MDFDYILGIFWQMRGVIIFVLCIVLGSKLIRKIIKTYKKAK